MNVRIPADIGFRRSTDYALVPVAFQCLPTDTVLARPVVARVAAFPVRVALAGERLGEPVVPTLVATERHFAVDMTRIAFNSSVTDGTVNLHFSAAPARVVAFVDYGWVSPIFGFNTRWTVQSLLFRRVIFEFLAAEFTQRQIFSAVVIRIFGASKRD